MRDYGVEGQLGLEKTFEEYIDKLCTIYDEVKRVLRKDGTCFVNLGDSYSGNRYGNTNYNEGFNQRWECSPNRIQKQSEMGKSGVVRKMDMPAKSLCLIPQRFAIEMVNRGWILRNVLIWHKPNPIPSSARDRFTVDFEQVYFFSKSRKYWFEPQYEPFLTESNAERPRMGQGNQTKYKQKRAQGMGGAGTSWKGHSGNLKADGTQIGNPALGRNKRCVWTIPTQAFPMAHFATYPEKLVEPMIKAGCPEFICSACGKPREKILKDVGEKTWTDKRNKQSADSFNVGTRGLSYGRTAQIEFQGYTDCGCKNREWRPGIVLDPFAGSGTTLQVAARLNRNYLGIELNPEYIEMAEKRVLQGETGISPQEQQQGQIPLFGMEAI